MQESFTFSTPQIDLGYVAEDEEKTFEVYAWSKMNPQANLSIENPQGLSIQIKPITLDVSDPENIKEGGPTQGYKINLTYRAIDLKKSIRKLVSFTSKEFPNAHPEIHLIGYKKP